MRHKLISAAVLAIIILAVSNINIRISFCHLSDTGSSVSRPAGDTYDLQFALFDSVSGAARIALIVSDQDIRLTNGVFQVSLDPDTTGATPGNLRLSLFDIEVSAAIDPPALAEEDDLYAAALR